MFMYTVRHKFETATTKFLVKTQSRGTRNFKSKYTQSRQS